jgi:hypothetical protein
LMHHDLPRGHSVFVITGKAIALASHSKFQAQRPVAGRTPGTATDATWSPVPFDPTRDKRSRTAETIRRCLVFNKTRSRATFNVPR